MTTSTRTPEYGLAKIVKPFSGFETKYQGLDPLLNPIALPGGLDPKAGEEGYDPNLLAGIRVPMGAKIYVWLPRYFPDVYGGTALNYRYRFVWRLRSLSEQTDDNTNELTAHFGRLLPGVAQEGRTTGPPALVALSPELSGPRFVIPTAFESVQIINNKFLVSNIGGVDQPVQHGTLDISGVPIEPEDQEPADIAVVSARTNTYTRENQKEQYQAPLSPNYPGPLVAPDEKVAAAGLLSQGFYSDQAGWASVGTSVNAGFPAGGQYVLYETEVKGDELIILLDRDPSADSGANPTWDFDGADRNVSRILGTDAGTRAAVPTLGVYIITGSGVASGQSYG